MITNEEGHGVKAGFSRQREDYGQRHGGINCKYFGIAAV